MIRVLASSVLDTPVEPVWSLIRDFSAIDRWLPGVAESALDEGGGKTAVGSTRHLTFADGSKMREKLLALSDIDMTVTFTILSSEVPVRNYVSTIRLQPISDRSRTFISWGAEFDVDPEQEATMRQRMVQGIYQPGFDSLNAKFGKGS